MFLILTSISFMSYEIYIRKLGYNATYEWDFSDVQFNDVHNNKLNKINWKLPIKI